MHTAHLRVFRHERGDGTILIAVDDTDETTVPTRRSSWHSRASVTARIIETLKAPLTGKDIQCQSEGRSHVASVGDIL